jgi:hypothetical protein
LRKKKKQELIAFKRKNLLAMLSELNDAMSLEQTLAQHEKE